MDAVRAANLALRFLLEVCALAALGYWGAKTGSSTLARLSLAVAAPLLTAVGWALFVSPKAPVDVPVVRWAVELAVFGCAAAALIAVDREGVAGVVIGVYAVNRILMALWDQ